MLPLLLTRPYLLVDLFLSVCTSVSGRVSLVCHLSLSSTRRRGKALSTAPVSPATGTKKTGHTSSLCRRKCLGYAGIIQDLGFLRIHENNTQRALTSQKASSYGLGNAADIVVFITDKHAHTLVHPLSTTSTSTHW